MEDVHANYDDIALVAYGEFLQMVHTSYSVNEDYDSPSHANKSQLESLEKFYNQLQEDIHNILEEWAANKFETHQEIKS